MVVNVTLGVAVLTIHVILQVFMIIGQIVDVLVAVNFGKVVV